MGKMNLKYKPTSEGSYYTGKKLTKPVMHTVQLPPMYKFKPKNGTDEQFPYYKFYKYIAKELGLGVEKLDVSGTVVNITTADKLADYTSYWIQLSRPYYGESLVQRDFSMFHLNYSPAVIDCDKDGVVYITGLNK